MPSARPQSVPITPSAHRCQLTLWHAVHCGSAAPSDTGTRPTELDPITRTRDQRMTSSFKCAPTYELPPFLGPPPLDSFFSFFSFFTITNYCFY